MHDTTKVKINNIIKVEYARLNMFRSQLLLSLYFLIVSINVYVYYTLFKKDARGCLWLIISDLVIMGMEKMWWKTGNNGHRQKGLRFKV